MTQQIKQHINLYSGNVSLDTADPWTWTGIRTLTLILFLICFLTTLGIGVQGFVLKRQNLFYQNAFVELKKDLALYANTLPDFILKNPQTASLSELYQNKSNKTIETWRAPYSFSRLFILLSELMPETVWLQNIQIKNQGNLVQLDGFASNEQDLQLFIHQLDRLRALTAFQMGTSHIGRMNDEKMNRVAYQFHVEVVANDKKTAAVS